MVRANFEDFDEHYEAIRISACGHQACSVLIMVALEVDAMSSARMLSQLLRGDNVAYLIRPVGNFTEVEAAFASNITSDIKTVFMINCGAIYDIPKAFGLEQGGGIRVFVLDNHRPVHLKNIYSRHNVVVFDDNYDINNPQDNDDVPSEASQMSSVKDEDDDDSLESKSSHSEEEEEDNDYEEAEEQEEQEEEFEMDVEVDQTKDDNEDPDAEEAEAEELNEDDEASDASEAKEISPLQTEEGGEEEEEVDKTFIGGWTGGAEQQPSSPHSQASQAEADVTVDQLDAGDEEEEEDVMHDDEQEEQEEEEENIKMKSKKRKLFTHNTTDPHKAKRLRIKAYYFQPISYSSPTSLMLLKHVQQRFAANGQMPLDVSWQTILGVTDMFMKGRLTEQQYEECCHHLKIQLGDRLHSLDRLSYTTSVAAAAGGDATAVAPAAVASITISGAQAGQIQETSEYRFFLHRHWSLYESMFHSSYIASRFPVWNARGLSKLQELLAEMGISLQQCKQSYNFMSPELRQHFRQMINSAPIQEKYGLLQTTVMYKSFIRYAGYKMPLAAEDVVQSTTALLELYSNKMVTEDVLVGQLVEHGGKENVPPTAGNNYEAHHHSTAAKEDKNTFFSAYELLGGRNDKLIKEGIHIALDIQRAIVKKASALIEGGLSTIPKYNRLYYAYLRNNLGGKMSENGSNFGGKVGENRVNSETEMELIFGRPMVLTRLGQFIMEVKRKLPKIDGGWVGSNLLPLILLSERQDGSYLVLGISPLSVPQGVEGVSEEMQEKLAPLVNFRQFFKLAAKDMNIKFHSNSFDPNVVEIGKEDTQDFLGALDNALKKATPNYYRATR